MFSSTQNSRIKQIDEGQITTVSNFAENKLLETQSFTRFRYSSTLLPGGSVTPGAIMTVGLHLDELEWSMPFSKQKFVAKGRVLHQTCSHL